MSAIKVSKLNLGRLWRGPAIFALTLLAVEFLDELIYGVQGAALPLIRDDLALTYTQVGLLLAAPHLVGNVLNPFIGVLGDVWQRRVLVAGGALATALALSLVAVGRSFGLLVFALCLAAPASTAYVSLSQGTLMDLNPGRHDQMMARWTVFGAAGVFIGPALVTGVVLLGFRWRGLYAGLAVLAALAGGLLWRSPAWRESGPPARPNGVWRGGRALLAAIGSSGLWRWIVLLELADLMLDVFYEFCALYFTDVVRVSAGLAGVAVIVLTLGGLVGDVLLIPVLEKFDGLRLIRITALLALGVYAAFLLIPGVWPKLALLALLGPLRSGWYQVLQGRAYSSLPGKSGLVVAATSLGGLLATSFPFVLGAVAQRLGLNWAMVMLVAAPISLLIGLRFGLPKD